MLFFLLLVLAFNVKAENVERESFELEIVSIEEKSDGSYAIELFVKANEAVDEACSWFNGSWADVGLTVYCNINRVSAVCTAYKITKAACSLNNAVKLMIEGDWNTAIKNLIIQASKTYNFTRIGSKEYEISEIVNYSPVW